MTTVWLSRAQALPLKIKLTTEIHDHFSIQSVLNSLRPSFLLEQLDIYILKNTDTLCETADLFFKDAPRLRRVQI